MIRGVVTDLRATLNVTLRLPNQPDLAIECVLDTGFRGALALPPEAVDVLGLPLVTEIETLPANGIPFRANLHLATLVWEEQTRTVPVLAMGVYPLLGTALLQGNDLHVTFEEGGEVRIEPRL